MVDWKSRSRKTDVFERKHLAVFPAAVFVGVMLKRVQFGMGAFGFPRSFLLTTGVTLLVVGSTTKPANAQQSRALIPPVVVSVEPKDLSGFAQNPLAVRQLLTSALSLTRKNLGYRFGSADPAERGMDCSGTIFYLLRNAGIRDVPRSSEGIYQWTRSKNSFHEVEASRLTSPEFADLRPGDLLFWTGTYAAGGKNVVTHTMIYLGKAKSDGLRLMVGASNGRTYRGKKCFGVSVFTFRLPPKGSKSRFIGFAKIPGLATRISSRPTVSTSDLQTPKGEDTGLAEPAVNPTPARPEGR